MTFHVEVSARAERDADAIVSYLKKRSQAGAARWVEAFGDTIGSLASSAEQHPLAPEDADHAESIRNAFFKTPRGRTYRAIYILRGGVVFITHVRGPGQDQISPTEFFGSRPK